MVVVLATAEKGVPTQSRRHPCLKDGSTHAINGGIHAINGDGTSRQQAQGCEEDTDMATEIGEEPAP